jgi:hypothetical protein
MALNDIAHLIGTDQVLSETYRTPSEVIKEREELDRQKEQEDYNRKQERNRQMIEWIKYNPAAIINTYTPQFNDKITAYQNLVAEQLQSDGELDVVRLAMMQQELGTLNAKAESIKQVYVDVAATTKTNPLYDTEYYIGKLNSKYYDGDTLRPLGEVDNQLGEGFYNDSKGFKIPALSKLAWTYFPKIDVATQRKLDDGSTMTSIDKRSRVSDKDGNINLQYEDINDLKSNPHIAQYLKDNVDGDVNTEKKVLEDLLANQYGISITSKKISNKTPSLKKYSDDDRYRSVITITGQVAVQQPSVLKSAQPTTIYSTEGVSLLNVTSEFSQYSLDEDNETFLFILPGEVGTIYKYNGEATLDDLKFKDLKPLKGAGIHNLIQGAYQNSKGMKEDEYNGFMKDIGFNVSQDFPIGRFAPLTVEQEKERDVWFDEAKRKSVVSSSIRELNVDDVLDSGDMWQKKSHFNKVFTDRFKGVALISSPGTSTERILKSPTFEKKAGENIDITSSDKTVKIKLTKAQLQSLINNNNFTVLAPSKLDPTPSGEIETPKPDTNEETSQDASISTEEGDKVKQNEGTKQTAKGGVSIDVMSIKKDDKLIKTLNSMLKGSAYIKDDETHIGVKFLYDYKTGSDMVKFLYGSSTVEEVSLEELQKLIDERKFIIDGKRTEAPNTDENRGYIGW